MSLCLTSVSPRDISSLWIKPGMIWLTTISAVTKTVPGPQKVYNNYLLHELMDELIPT